jgi:Asp-tRNA(Asn)/Glu-tRNA(Gln) amidotransferase A subunit family amidase
MVTSDLAYKSAVELADLIRGREISPREVIRHSLERIADVNPALNCFCFVFGDEALDKARDAERAVMEGKRLGPLHGVPVAIKDLSVANWHSRDDRKFEKATAMLFPALSE